MNSRTIIGFRISIIKGTKNVCSHFVTANVARQRKQTTDDAGVVAQFGITETETLLCRLRNNVALRE